MEGAGLEIDLKDLKNLAKQLENKKEVQVGIFEEDDQRKDGKKNSEIGFDHEFGNPLKNLPMRSWLREPIYSREQQLQEAAQNALDETGSINEAYKALAKEAEHIVEGAFASGGYGKWERLSTITIDMKGNSDILIDTGDFKDSVKAKVVKL